MRSMERQPGKVLALLGSLILASGCSLPAQVPSTPHVDVSQADAGATPISALALTHPELPAGEHTPTTTVAVAARPGAPLDMIIYPQQYSQYQIYLDVIGARPRAADTAIIEATVTSLQTGAICPYDEENCRIAPYPNDWGTVRLDRILDHSPYGEHREGAGEEKPGQLRGLAAVTAAGSSGVELEPGERMHEPLQVGQELETQFVLTARPTKVRSAPIIGSEAGPQELPAAGRPEETTGQQAQAGAPEYLPIAKEGGYFIFVKETELTSGSTESLLSGLSVGSRFRAEIRYDGTLYVHEYEVIP